MAKIKLKPENTPFLGKDAQMLIGGAIVLLLIFWGSYEFFRMGSSVNYQGLEFVKEKMGAITFYRYTYHFTDDVGRKIVYSLRVRNDPSKNDVPVNGTINFNRGNTLYLGINSSGLSQCNDSMIAVAGALAGFLRDNQFKVKIGTPNALEANLTNYTYVSCDTGLNNTVIIADLGSETRITQETQNCYRILATNCEILKAVEKFEVQAVVDAKKTA